METKKDIRLKTPNGRVSRWMGDEFIVDVRVVSDESPEIFNGKIRKVFVDKDSGEVESWVHVHYSKDIFGE